MPCFTGLPQSRLRQHGRRRLHPTGAGSLFGRAGDVARNRAVHFCEHGRWLDFKEKVDGVAEHGKQDDFKLTPESFATAFDLRVCWHGNKPFVSKPERTPNQTYQNGTSPNGPMTGAKATGGEAEDGNRQLEVITRHARRLLVGLTPREPQLSKEIPT